MNLIAIYYFCKHFLEIFFAFLTSVGSVWTKEPNVHINWEIEIVFRINGRGRIGADGLVSML